MSTRYTCLECGTGYNEHVSFCGICWHQGQVVPTASRQHAALDFQPAVSDARSLARLVWRELEQTAYPELKLGTGAMVLLSGYPTQGKSTSATRLLDSVKGPVVYVASEEGLSPTLAGRLSRCAVKRSDFFVMSRATVDQVASFAVEKKAVAVAVDSVQHASWTATELRHLQSVVPSMDLLVAVVQVTKDGLPAGAMSLQHEADVHLSVEKMRWTLVKSRYQPIGVEGDVVVKVDHGPTLEAAMRLSDAKNA